MNRLSTERSAYLRHAADQKINWYPWCEEAFEKAAQEDKPVFLSSGAIWCHWCHVMAKESFDDDRIAEIINENYVAVKLDRDERPDIDRRYQQAVSAMNQSGGWPLSVFLTPGKKPFFGGTYFPPVETRGMPAFSMVLIAISQYYKEKRQEIEENGTIFIDVLKSDRRLQGSLKRSAIDEAVLRMLASSDNIHGGFGTSPKFPMPGALEFLLGRYFFSGDKDIEVMLRKTFSSMTAGGFHDQIGGGFHRYSTDNRWAVPHFEKMADDNAWLLRNYCDACRIFGDDYLKDTAQGIISFIDRELSDPEGGFYASMDADVTPDDEGGYFTWTREDLRHVLNDEEFQVISTHLFDTHNAMHHAPDKVVLFACGDADSIARKSGMDAADVKRIITSGKEKLLAERERREKPYIDTALYTSLNGMMIAAYCKAYRTFADRAILDRAVAAVQKVRSTNMDGVKLHHCEGVEAFLEDYVYFCDALIALYESTGERQYLDDARGLMDQCLADFWDSSEAGFFDTRDEVIGLRLKGIEDVPRPSPNAVAAMCLLKLAAMLGEERYSDYAEGLLSTFVSDAAALSFHGGYYFCALDAFYRMVKLEVRAGVGSSLAEAARSSFYPNSSIVYGEPAHDDVIPCVGTTCYEPLKTVDGIDGFLKGTQEWK